MKMQRTIVIRRDYLHYIRKYNRFEKRHKNMSVHLSPCFRCSALILLLREARISCLQSMLTWSDRPLAAQRMTASISAQSSLQHFRLHLLVPQL
ncbi:40S ribosomal protein S11 isoform X1 [Meleagris gallopavo]|uniref:40S ribosomal protein S11 isoform X1 n=1 Tax=Meleagris gallopavo TaxID=9103 RepID=UPI0012AC58C5|nr:40S ribosomal protein S11 isoform X1 [Meleagris gallopavo]